MKTLEAFFDGHIFIPVGRTDLTPDRYYIISLKEKDSESDSLNAFDVLYRLTGTVEAPEDWAGEHDRYIYGVQE